MADNPDIDDILRKFFRKTVYKNFTYSHCLYQADEPGDTVFFIIEGQCSIFRKKD